MTTSAWADVDAMKQSMFRVARQHAHATVQLREQYRGEHPSVYLSVHFAPERFPYGGPGNPEGIGAAEPNFTSVLLVWRAA